MKRTYKGKSDNGFEIVVYILDDATEVLKILDNIQKAAPGYSFSSFDSNYFRFLKTDEGMYLVAGTSSSSCNDGKSCLENVYAEDVEDFLKGISEKYSTTETSEGFLQIELNEYLDNPNQLCDIFREMMSSDKDFNLMMPEGSVHMAWLPEISDENRYVLKPFIIPSFSIDEWDTKSFEEYEIRLF